MWSLCALSMLLALSGGGLAAGAAAPLAAEAAGGARQQTAPPGRKGGATITLAEARKFLEGRWALESLELRPAGGGAPIAVKGAGVLNYDDFGNLNMEIRADQASSDLLRAAGVNIRDGIVSTEGRTAIDLQNRTLTYFIKDQPAQGQGPLAMNRPRHWEVNGNTLTLTTRDDKGAPMSISRWKRSGS